MTLSPDAVTIWRVGSVAINATLAFTWLVMVLLTLGAWLVTRGLASQARPVLPHTMVEMLVTFVLDQIRDVTEQDPEPYLPFVGTLFVFIAACNVLTIVPGFMPPTASLSTTAALALSVLVAVPAFGVARLGVVGYLRAYLRPTPWMLPFKLVSEASRTLALAVRLFGNIMSGTVIVAILVSIAPLLFPAVMQAFGLLIGVIQAYIFAILAIVYIASGTSVQAGGNRSGNGKGVNA